MYDAEERRRVRDADARAGRWKTGTVGATLPESVLIRHTGIIYSFPRMSTDSGKIAPVLEPSDVRKQYFSISHGELEMHPEAAKTLPLRKDMTMQSCAQKRKPFRE